MPGLGERGAAGAEPGRAERCHTVAAGDSKVRLRGGRGLAGQAAAGLGPGLAAAVPRGRCGAAGGHGTGLERAEGRQARLSRAGTRG